MNGLTNRWSFEFTRGVDATADPQSDGLECLFDLSPALLCIVGADTYFRRVNPAFTEKLGYTETELLSSSFIEFVHPDDLAATLHEVRKLSTETSAVHFHNRYRHANGSYRWLLWRTAREHGQWCATALDITRPKQADNKYRKLQQEAKKKFLKDERRLQEMTKRLVLVEENERRRIARGLHDDVGQTLVAAKVGLEELTGELTGDRESLAVEVQQLLSEAIESMRSLSFDLASAVLYDVGLGAAMQSLCERAMQRSGIEFQPPEGLKGNPIPESTRVILYRAGRELIQNIVKHSTARTAKLSLTLRNGLVRLTAQDDGCGFDVMKQRQNWDATTGFGLFSIAQQLHPIGGQLQIESTPGHGTRATVIVPLTVEVAT